MDEQSIFAAALEKTPAERTAFLDAACGGNTELRARVQSLLNAFDAAGGFLEPDQAGQATVDRMPIAEQVGSTIGPYKLMEQIGEGGFGVVFVAKQERPIHRNVALKIIKPGMDSKEIIARFEAERQALALMDHPNIAHVLDAGTTDSGRPYFVMELIKGIPIIEYCDQQQLTTHERLELFVAVCQAVQHAHSKGIIHRDLKPSNILVAPHDGRPVVKVIDFGIAKAIGQQLTEKTIYTRLSQMIGTPLYMSPEQAEVNALDVDTRSDIYSLGVLLYELLTGTTPFDRQRFATAAYDEIRRIIREEDPPKPSRRLSTRGDTLPKVSANRKTEPAKLPSIVAGDLDWIVMKALEKDRTRRYETATGFAADVRRYLANEPIEARPPSATYRLQKFARRNKASFVTGTIVAAALLFGITGIIVQAIRLSRLERWNAKELVRAQQLTSNLEDTEKTLRWHRYTSDMPSVLQAWNRGNVRHARALLDRNRPGSGEDDPRGIEWDFLTNLVRVQATDIIEFKSRPMKFAMAPDGGRLAVTHWDGTLSIVDTRTRKVIREFHDAVSATSTWCCIAWSSDGNEIVCRDPDRSSIVIRDLATNNSMSVPLGTELSGVFASPKRNLLALPLPDNLGVQIRDARTGSMLTTIPVKGNPYFCSFSPDAKELVVADYTSPAISVWDIQTKQNVEKVATLSGPSSPALAIAWSPDGGILATGGYDQVVRIWDGQNYRPVKDVRGHTGAIFSVAFSAAGDELASTSRDNTVRIWSVPDFRLLHVLRGHSQAVGRGVFCDEDQTIVSCGDLTVQFWNLQQIEPIRTIHRKQQVRNIVFLDDHQYVFYEFHQSQVYLGNVDTMKEALFCTAGNRVYTVVACPNHQLAIGRVDGKIELWDTHSKKLVRVIEADTKQRVVDLQCDHRTQRLAGATAGATAGGLHVWQLDDDGAKLLYSRSQVPVGSVCFLGQGRVICGSDNGDLELCNYETNEILQDVRNAHREAITRIDFAPDKHLVVSCSLDGRVRFWDSQTLAPRGELRDTLGRQWWTCFSPDNKTLLTTGDDSYVTVWDIASGEQKFQFPRLAGAGKCLAISPSGKWLAATTLNGQIHIWDVGSSRPRP